MSDSNVDEALRQVVTRMIRRGVRLARRTNRVITITRSASARPVDIRELDPDTPEGAERLLRYLRGKVNFYTFAGLGKLSEKNRIHWTAFNRPCWRRTLIFWIMTLAMFLRSGTMKNRLYRLAGVHLGRDAEIMQAAWLDHFCPELIFVGDHTLIGAFCKLSTHAYEGGGKFRVGIAAVGNDCVLASGVSLAAIRIGDGTRVLPNTTLSPYFARLHRNSLVGQSPPSVKRLTTNNQLDDSEPKDKNI